MSKFVQTPVYLKTNIDDVLLQVAVGSLFAAGDNEFVTLGFEPFLDAELVLNGTEEARLLLSGIASLVEDGHDLQVPRRLLVEGG